MHSMENAARDDFTPERLVAQSGDGDFGKQLLRLLADDGARYVAELRTSVALHPLPTEALRRQLHGIKIVFGAVGAAAAVGAAVITNDKARARRLAALVLEQAEGVLGAARAYLERRDV